MPTATQSKSKTWIDSACRYDVVPMKPELAPHVLEVEEAMREGTVWQVDPKREGFVAVQGRSAAYYLHIHSDFHAIYLIARSPA